MSSNIVQPPLDGSIPTIPDFLDFHSQHNPNQPWAMFPSTQDATQVSYITFRQICEASHRVAEKIRPGRGGPEDEIIVLLLHTDTLLYLAMIMGLARAGAVVRLPLRYDCATLIVSNVIAVSDVAS